MKRIFVCLLILTLLLCGCGKEEPKPTEPAPQTQPQTEETLPTDEVLMEKMKAAGAAVRQPFGLRPAG